MNSEADQLDDDEPYREIIPTEEFMERVGEASNEEEEENKTPRPELVGALLTFTGFTEQPPG